MVTANPGMTSGTYSLRGDNLYNASNGSQSCKSENIDPSTNTCRDSSYYTSNVQVLYQAFGENSGYCNTYSSTSNGNPITYVNCTVSELHAGVYSNGNVGAIGGYTGCYVDRGGSSYCA